jgi:hypothetical protein
MAMAIGVMACKYMYRNIWKYGLMRFEWQTQMNKNVVSDMRVAKMTETEMRHII